MHQPAQTDIEKKEAAASDPLAVVKKLVQSCIQCGTCTGSCPNAYAMDFTPRRLWRMVLMGQKDEIFNSKTFGLCSACYFCTLRCPRGLLLTEAMSALKQIGAREDLPINKPNNLFYKNFMGSVRRHGRVREMEFMTLYFATMKNPWLPFRFAPLGMKLMRKGKVSIQIPSKGKGTLDAIFRKAAELEVSP
ncbi:MAG: 4Fe-4S dicluster domain-containing protein [Desulfobacterales bacterium]|jgi:heterodisulfide reductase subunit C